MKKTWLLHYIVCRQVVDDNTQYRHFVIVSQGECEKLADLNKLKQFRFFGKIIYAEIQVQKICLRIWRFLEYNSWR